MASVDIKQATRTNWTVETSHPAKYPGDENIKIGCMQRIADATELMAKDRQKLIDDYDYLKRNRDYYRERCAKLEKSNAGLKGVITKLKKNPLTTTKTD